MLKFYFNSAPNPLKVALFLEETGLSYQGTPVDTKLGEQRTDTFRRINPNAKVPALQDGGTTLFDSKAILLYLREKTGQFMPPQTANRGGLLPWLMFAASGVGPYFGQCVHFRHFAPEKLAFPQKRYEFEARRHWQIFDDRLGETGFMLGDTYTIVDIAVWKWATCIPFFLCEVAMESSPNLTELMDWTGARPATRRTLTISDWHRFKRDFDESAMQNLFPHLIAEDQS